MLSLPNDMIGLMIREEKEKHDKFGETKAVTSGKSLTFQYVVGSV